MNKKNKNWKLKQLLLDLLFFLVLLALDQGTKYLAVTHLKDRSSVKIWPGVFELQYLENRGAAFGILQDGKLFFVFAAIVMLTVIAFILVKTPKGKKYRTWHILLTFIAAGAIGNMICINNIVAVCATTGIVGMEGKLIRTNIVPWFVYYVILISVMLAAINFGLVPQF